MIAYVMVRFTPKDPEKLQQYAASVPPTLAQHGGEVLAKGPLQPLYGNSNYQTQVIIAFPSKEAAIQWYNSEAYQALIPIRDASMNSQFQLLG